MFGVYDLCALRGKEVLGLYEKRSVHSCESEEDCQCGRTMRFLGATEGLSEFEVPHKVSW